MPINIDDYSAWARQNMDSEVAIRTAQNNGAATRTLESASNQVGFFARFFGMQSAKNVRETVMADFTRALSVRFGATLAQSALYDVGLSKSSKLEGKTIIAVIRRAAEIRGERVDDLRSRDLRLMTGTVTINDIRGYDLEDRTLIDYYIQLRSLAVDALGETPVDADALADFREHVNSVKQKLAAAATQLANVNANAPKISPNFQLEAQRLVASLDAKLLSAAAAIDNRPLSDANLQHFKDVWRDATAAALTRLASEATSQATRDALNALSASFRGGALNNSIPVAKDAASQLADLVLGRLATALPQGSAVEFDKDTIKARITSAYRQTLNEQPWPVIDKHFDAVVGSTPVAMTSTIVPGARIGAPANADRGPIGERYPEGVGGYMCHSANTGHAVNLAVSSLSVPDASGTPQVVFRGIRHGVHCAWEIDNDSARAAANKTRAEEAVIAAFLADPANARRITTKTENGRTERVVDLNMVSVSLLTPDYARLAKHGVKSLLGKKGGDDDEHLMLLEQKDAWEAVERDGVEFSFGGQTIRIKPQVMTFNFGVNAGAVKYGTIAPDIAGGWSISDMLNQAAMTRLRPHVERFVADGSIAPDKKNAVRKLFNQCVDVLRNCGELSDNHDAYKVAARLAVLTNLMGWTPCWNCKSGKDRTGEMDVECKFLSALIARNQQIPEPGAKLTDDQKKLFRAIAFEGGNFELQRLNTGVGGYKTEGVDSIPERLGGDDFREFHRGGSPLVGV